MQLAGTENKTGAVNKAITSFIRQERLMRFKKLRGKLDFPTNEASEAGELERADSVKTPCRTGSRNCSRKTGQRFAELPSLRCGKDSSLTRSGMYSTLFETLPYFETTREDYDAAGALLAGLRRDGITIPVMDGLIAQIALRHQVPLLEKDKHFKHIEGLERISWREP